MNEIYIQALELMKAIDANTIRIYHRSNIARPLGIIETAIDYSEMSGCSVTCSGLRTSIRQSGSEDAYRIMDVHFSNIIFIIPSDIRHIEFDQCTFYNCIIQFNSSKSQNMDITIIDSTLSDTQFQFQAFVMPNISMQDCMIRDLIISNDAFFKFKRCVIKNATILVIELKKMRVKFFYCIFTKSVLFLGTCDPKHINNLVFNQNLVLCKIFTTDHKVITNNDSLAGAFINAVFLVVGQNRTSTLLVKELDEITLDKQSYFLYDVAVKDSCTVSLQCMLESLQEYYENVEDAHLYDFYKHFIRQENAITIAKSYLDSM